MAGWVPLFSLELAPLPALNSEIGIDLLPKDHPSQGKPLGLFRMIEMEGWGITVPSSFRQYWLILSMGKLRPQCQSHPGQN